MVRQLPWKHGTVTKTSKDKGKSKDSTHRGQSIATLNDRQDLADEDETRDKGSDDSDDENYRITESEFMDTARYFTRDLHQQAYERLIQQQQKEIENRNTLSDLLEQPMLPSEDVSVPPPRTTGLEAKSANPSITFSGEPQVVSSGSSHLPNATPLQMPQKEERPALLSTSIADNIPGDAIKSVSESKQTTVTKLSDAAAARRRKRQQAQKAEVVVSRII